MPQVRDEEAELAPVSRTLVLTWFFGTVGWEDAGCFRRKELSVSRPYPPEFRRQALALVASGRTVVDVAAGGKAQVTLSVNPARLTDHPGLYEGHVVVRDSDQTIHIPISLYVTPPTHMLTLTATALPGTASSGLSAFANVINADDPDLFSSFVFLGATQAASVQVPDGDYWVTGEVDDLSNPQLMRSAIVGEPDVLVGADTSVTLDAANAVPVAVSVVGRATETDGSDVFAERGVAGRTFGFGCTRSPPRRRPRCSRSPRTPCAPAPSGSPPDSG